MIPIMLVMVAPSAPVIGSSSSEPGGVVGAGAFEFPDRSQGGPEPVACDVDDSPGGVTGMNVVELLELEAKP